jgi:hypothetical protein
MRVVPAPIMLGAAADVVTGPAGVDVLLRDREAVVAAHPLRNNPADANINVGSFFILLLP